MLAIRAGVSSNGTGLDKGRTSSPVQAMYLLPEATQLWPLVKRAEVLPLVVEALPSPKPLQLARTLEAEVAVVAPLLHKRLLRVTQRAEEVPEALAHYPRLRRLLRVAQKVEAELAAASLNQAISQPQAPASD